MVLGPYPIVGCGDSPAYYCYGWSTSSVDGAFLYNELLAQVGVLLSHSLIAGKVVSQGDSAHFYF